MTTMQITGAAVGTINLNDNVNCQIADPGWVPAVSRRKKNAMGNQSLYEDVVETIPLRVFSENATPATARQEVMDWLHDLSAALDQADEWYEGMNTVDAVLFEYKAEDSSLTNPLSAAILGVPEGVQGVLEFKGSFNQGLQVYEIFIDLTFTRRGALLEDEDSDTAASTVEITYPDDVALTSALKLPSPVDVSFEITNMADNSPRGYLALMDDIDDIYVLRGRDRDGSLSSGNIVGTTSNLYPRTASGSMWQDTFTTSATWGRGIATTSVAGARMYEVILSIHLTSGTGVTAYYLHHSLGLGTALPSASTNRKVVIDSENAGDPNFISLGLLAVPKIADYESPYIQIVFEPIDSGTSNTIKIDVVAIIRRDKQGSMVIKLNETPLDTSDPNDIWDFKHHLLDDIQPSYSAYGTVPAVASRIPCNAEGDKMIMNSGQNPAAVLLATTEDYWRFGNGTGVASTELTMTRRPAYLVPV